MGTQTLERIETSKERMVFYLDPRLARLIKHERAATDKPMSLIVEERLIQSFGPQRVAAIQAAG